jgi:hypothetical protein
MVDALRSIVIALIVLGAIACKGDGAPSAPAIVAGAPAGDVTEAAGDVKATRGGKTRAIAKGDVVAGDDVIATGADGRVTIVLRHNQVPWSLGPNLTKKVGDSAAWTAAKGAKPEDVTDDHSAAAGRHAERSATETAASTDVAPQQADQQLAQAKDDAERAALKAKLDELQKQQGEEERRHPPCDFPPCGGAKRTSKCDPADPLCDLDGHATAPGGGGGGGEVDGAIDREAIQRVMRAHAADFQRCYQDLLKSAPDAKGTLHLHITIVASGKVPNATADGDAALQPMFACAQKAATKLVFPATNGTLTISYPMVFSAQQ